MDLSVMEILYCWQSVILAAGVSVITKSIKNVFIIAAGDDEVKQAWARHVALPIVPLVLGSISAVVFPLHPTALSRYIEQDHVQTPWLVYFCYGGAVGTFADYMYQRVNGVLKVRDAHGNDAVPQPANDDAKYCEHQDS
jgi:hypothetical protein